MPDGKPGTVQLCTSLPDAVREAWMVVESVPETLETKSKVLGDLSRLMAQDCILATNSSSYTGSELAGFVAEDVRSQFINTHYYGAPERNLLEIMPNQLTDPAIAPFVAQVAQKHGLDPVLVNKESPGYIANRVWAAVMRESLQLAAQGIATPETIDRTLDTLVPGVKPFALMDQQGLGAVHTTESHFQSTASELGKLYPSVLPYLERKLEHSELGWATDKGFYDYTPADKQPHLLYLDVVKGYAARRPLDGRATSMIAMGLHMPDGVIAAPDGSVFIGCMGATEAENNGYIVRAYPPSDLVSSDDWIVRTVVPQGISRTPKQLVLDETADKIYWSDREAGRVWRCNYDGSEREVVWASAPPETPRPLEDQSKHCVGIAVDPAKGWVYWTHKGMARGGQGRILRAPLADPAGGRVEEPHLRTDVEVLYDHLPEPIDLHLAEGGKQLYWTDRGVGAVFSAPLPQTFTPSLAQVKGDMDQAKATISQPPTLISDHFHQTIGLALDESAGHLYVTDLGGAIYRINLDGSSKIRIRDTDHNGYTGIALQFPLSTN